MAISRGPMGYHRRRDNARTILGCQTVNHSLHLASARSSRKRHVQALDSRPVGGGLYEMRVHRGPGYRIYFLRDGTKVVLLCGGDKGSQQRDIARAERLARDWRRT